MRPLVLHGNGPTDLILNSLGNYIPKAWNSEDQCTSCWENTIEFEGYKEKPEVVLAIFIVQETPFIDEFFRKIISLDYRKDKIDLFIHNLSPYHNKDVKDFLELIQSGNDDNNKYHSIEIIEHDKRMNERIGRNRGIQRCLDLRCDYYFSVDSVAHIENENTLKLLIEQNRDIIAPLMTGEYQSWNLYVKSKLDTEII